MELSEAVVPVAALIAEAPLVPIRGQCQSIAACAVLRGLSKLQRVVAQNYFIAITCSTN